MRPADGLPAVVVDRIALVHTADAIASGSGPIAVDAERASGFRYSQRAYLVQLRRAGAGSALIDPIPLGSDLSALAPALTGPEWVLHAASQDLACLAEVGLAPSRLFDTELAARIAGLPRVGLGPLVEQLLGLSLEKGHGAADWSRRPLPEDWLVYAALDVEVLVELRDELARQLAEQGKLEWAWQEFEAVRTAPPPVPRAEPWRRLSGVHKLRKPRLLAAARALWEARDRLAAERDIAPGRVLPDSAIVDGCGRRTHVRTGPRRDAGLPRTRPAPPHARTGSRPWRRRPRSTPPTTRAPPRPTTDRPRSRAGPTATRTPPRGSQPPAPPWPTWASSGTCRWRTCCSPTCCGACAGARPPTATWGRPYAPAVPGSGRSTS